MDDDGVLDWLGEFSRSPDMGRLLAPLEESARVEWVDDRLCAAILGSSLVLASMAGMVLPPSVFSLTTAARSLGSPAPSIVAKSVDALDKVRCSSELQESWQDAGEAEYEDWMGHLDALKVAVGGLLESG